MRKSSFKKHLEALDEDSLRSELLRIFDKLEAVRKYYKLELGTESDRVKVYKKAKKEIASKFATKSYRRPRRPRIQKVNSIIRTLEKESIFSFEMIDIYLFATEEGLRFMKEYNFFSEVLDNHIVRSFKKAQSTIQENHMEDDFADRVDRILSSINRYPGLRMRV